MTDTRRTSTTPAPSPGTGAAAPLALLGRKRVNQATPPLPQETVRSVKADIDELKEMAQR